MPRIQLVPLTSYLHSFTRRVTVTDLNYLGHLDHSSVVKISHEARADFFRRCGISERNIMIGDLACQYLQPGELFDELQVDTSLGEPGRCGFRVFHQIRARVPLAHTPAGGGDFLNAGAGSGASKNTAGALFRPIALVEMGMVAVDANTKAAMEIPQEFYERLGLFRADSKKPGISLPPPEKIFGIATETVL